jgi:hypothetical protein
MTGFWFICTGSERSFGTNSSHLPCRPLQVLIGNRLFKAVDGLSQLFVDHMQVFGPVADVPQIGGAVGDAAQADQGDTVELAGAQHGKRLHLDHLGLDRVVGLPRDDGDAGGERRPAMPGTVSGSGTTTGKSRNGVAPLVKPSGEARVAVGDGCRLIDSACSGVGLPAEPSETTSDGNWPAISRRVRAGGQDDGRLDRPDTGHQWREAILEMRAVFGIYRHDVEDPAVATAFRSFWTSRMRSVIVGRAAFDKPVGFGDASEQSGHIRT